MTDRQRGKLAANLDPEIARFVRAVAESLLQHEVETLPLDEFRSACEKARARWTEGGPIMWRTRDHAVPDGESSIRIRLYDSVPEAPKPALVYLHGGGWTLFSLDTHDRVMREYAARTGFAVIGVDYSLSPEAKFPAALLQVVEVVDWMSKSGSALGIDATRLAIGGDSAGANLALAACLELKGRGQRDAVRAMVLNYGAYDSKCSPDAERLYGGDGHMLNSDEMRAYWDNYLRSPADKLDPLACPIHASLGGLPPAFLAIPQCDLLAEQNLIMADKLRRANVPVDVNVYEGACHSFLEAVSIATVSDRAFTDTAKWLRAKVLA